MWYWTDRQRRTASPGGRAVEHSQLRDFRRHLNVGWLTRRRRRDHELRGVLIELQRAHTRRVTCCEIIPSPTRAEPFIVEGAVVADDATLHLPDPNSLQYGRPFSESRAGGSSPVVKRGRIAKSDDQHVALQHTILNFSDGEDAGAIAVVPPELIGGDCQRQNFLC